MSSSDSSTLRLEALHKAQFMRSILRTMVVMAAIGLGAALIDRRNNPLVSIAFYLPIFLAVYWMRLMLSRGRVEVAAWASALFFWGMIAFVTLFFGGLKGANAACFTVCTMLIGTLVGGRAALAMAIGSTVWCGIVGALELYDVLPAQLGPYTPINAWTALAVCLLMTSVILRRSLDSMRAVHAQAASLAAERDEALRRSIHAQKMELVGNLAGGVAHDFNNLLTVITGVSTVLREDLEARRFSDPALLDDLDAATERAALMTRQLLMFGRIQPVALEAVDVGDTVRAFSALLPRLLGPSITIDADTAPGILARASRVGIEQILLNLAVNARDAMPAGGRLRIRALANGEHAQIVVEDTGNGIPPEVRPHIWNPFFTTKSTGTGLGLATVRTAVEEFGGTIDVTSEVGRGSRFEIQIPRVAHAAADVTPLPAGPTAVPTPALARRLLLVEDDPLVRRVTARVLTQAGFEVIATNDGAEALDALARTPDVVCVVSDISMPVLDGIELAARLAKSSPRLPVLLISGDRAPAEAIASPLRAFVAKPIERKGLVAAIEQLLEASTAAR